MNYKVYLNNGQVIELNNAELDAETFTETLNTQNIIFVNIGDTVINKHLLQLVSPTTVEE